jgi:hypothetical protein
VRPKPLVRKHRAVWGKKSKGFVYKNPAVVGGALAVGSGQFTVSDIAEEKVKRSTGKLP